MFLILRTSIQVSGLDQYFMVVCHLESVSDMTTIINLLNKEILRHVYMLDSAGLEITIVFKCMLPFMVE